MLEEILKRLAKGIYDKQEVEQEIARLGGCIRDNSKEIAFSEEYYNALDDLMSKVEAVEEEISTYDDALKKEKQRIHQVISGITSDQINELYYKSRQALLSSIPEKYAVLFFKRTIYNREMFQLLSNGRCKRIRVQSVKCNFPLDNKAIEKSGDYLIFLAREYSQGTFLIEKSRKFVNKYPIFGKNIRLKLEDMMKKNSDKYQLRFNLEKRERELKSYIHTLNNLETRKNQSKRLFQKILQETGYDPDPIFKDKRTQKKSKQVCEHNLKFLHRIARKYNKLSDKYSDGFGLDIKKFCNEYSLMTKHYAKVLLYSKGKFYQLYETNKNRLLKLKPYDYSGGFEDLEKKYLREGSIVTSDGAVLRGKDKKIAKFVFDQAKKGKAIIRRFIDWNESLETRVRNLTKPRKPKTQSYQPKLRTKPQKYLKKVLNPLKPEIYGGSFFASGGEYVAFRKNGITFVEYNYEGNATYMFQSDKFDPNTDLTRSQIIRTRAIGYMGRIYHDPNKDYFGWKTRVNGLIGGYA